MSQEYSISMNTEYRTLRIKLSISNVTVAFGDQKQVTESVSLPFTKSMSCFFEVSPDANDDPKGIYLQPYFINRTQDKTIWILVSIDKRVDTTDKYECQYQDKNYRKMTFCSNTALKLNSLHLDRKTYFSNFDDLHIQVRLTEARKKDSESMIHDGIEKGMATLLSALYTNDDFKDVELKVGDKSLMAHKAIITNRSKVFHAMFTHDTKEKAEGIIEINDVGFETLETFVKYLYTNQVEDKCLSEEMLFLADKYDVQCLRDRCERFVGQMVCESNAVGYLIKADAANFKLLRKRALDVIITRLPKIRKSEDFKLLNDHSDLLNEIYENYFDESKVIECTLAPVAV